jgi:hypothetical protein
MTENEKVLLNFLSCKGCYFNVMGLPGFSVCLNNFCFLPGCFVYVELLSPPLVLDEYYLYVDKSYLPALKFVYISLHIFLRQFAGLSEELPMSSRFLVR